MGVQRVGSGLFVDVKLPAVDFHSSCDVEATLPPGIPDIDERLVCARMTCRRGTYHDGKACLECSHYRGWRDGPGLAHITVHCEWSADTPVRERMTRDPLLIGSELDCDAADTLMRKAHVRHLIVVDGGRLAGVLCRCDLYAPGGNDRVGARMSRDVFTITPDATLGHALAAFARLPVGCLPVVDGDRIVGILTRGDLRRAGVPEPLLGGKSCALCGSCHGVRPDPVNGLDCCLDCIDVLESAMRPGDLGEGD